jgi:hypothetical protein
MFIFPETLTFKRPVTIVFDISRTPMTLDKTGLGLLRTSKDQPQPIPSLLVRSLTTDKIITARITSGGLYSVSQNTQSQISAAKKALIDEKTNGLNLLESATILTDHQQKLSAADVSKIQKVISTLTSNKSTSPIEFLIATQLKQSLSKLSTQSLVKPVYAADTISDYLKSRCGDQFLNEYEYWSLAENARLGGYTDIEETCRNNAKRLVRAETDKLLAQADPEVFALIQQMQKCQQFKFSDDYISKIQDKLDKVAEAKAKKALEEALKKSPKTKAELEQAIDAITKAIQEAQATGSIDQTILDQMQQKMADWATERADQILKDPNSKPIDIVAAVEAAMSRGASEQEVARLTEQMKNRLKPRNPQDVANDPNATMAEVAVALGNDEQPPDAATKQQLTDKLQTLRKQKVEEERKKWAQPSPTPTPEPGELEWDFDPGVIGVVMLQGLFGLDSFTEGGLDKLASEMRQQAEEVFNASKGLCDATDELKRAYGSDDIPPEILAQYQQACSDVRSGEAMNQTEEYLGEVEQMADEVGDNQQQYQEDAQEEDPDHIKIDIEPSPSPENEINPDSTLNPLDNPPEVEGIE